jgi:hypothetical protein
VTLTLVLTATGCGSSEPSVELKGGTQATGGKALVFTASTDEKLAIAGGKYQLELRGVDLKRHDRPDYRDKHVCAGPPCEWTVVPDTASTYEFRAFLVDFQSGKSAGQSQPVQLVWAAPPAPRGLKLLINGKRLPTTPLEGGTDDYLKIPAGKVQVEAKWTTEARGTGYYVLISAGNRDYARCSTGTSCRVPAKAPLLDGQEVSWVAKILTTRGDKLVTGFKVCLEGSA